jgi:hypothetical protein
MNINTVVLVYNIILRKSFEAIRDLFDLTKYLRNIIIMLVDSKIDRKEQREI